jgi:hypothetical protein
MAKSTSKAKKRPRTTARGSARAGKSTRSKAARKAKSATRRRQAKRPAPAKKASKKTRPSAAAPARAKRSKPAEKARARSMAKPAPSQKPRAKAAASSTTAVKRPRRAPTLDRERRLATDPEMVPTPPSSLNLDRTASAARSGRAELAHKIHEYTSTGPEMTAGDVDADWESADSVGDEAPGGDNPTPDQDVVDDIGRSLGVEYDDDEELQGGAEIGERDRKRWELDPASSDDFDERDDD